MPTKNLANHLVKEKIINIEEESILLTTEEKQAAIVVLTKIYDSLETHSTEKFDALISIMEQYGDTSCLDVISKMRQDLLQNTTGNDVCT